MAAAADDQATTEAIFAVQLAELQHRFPDLTSAQCQEIEQRLSKNLRMGQVLRTVKLTNADEPAFVFVPGAVTVAKEGVQ